MLARGIGASSAEVDFVASTKLKLNILFLFVPVVAGVLEEVAEEVEVVALAGITIEVACLDLESLGGVVKVVCLD